MSATLFVDAGQVVTCESAQPASVCTGVAVAVEDGRIAAIDAQSTLEERWPDASRVRCGGAVLTPGFVDSHTHAVFGRWRAGEYAMRVRGVPYMEIARQGGGINASVADLRERSEANLVELTRARLAEILRMGTTTLEVKSGYGLTVEDELKMLRVVRTLGGEGPLDLVPTFMGAHEFPPDYRARRSGYVDLVVHEMIPAVAHGKLARFCDVFMEPGVFTASEARRILEAGLEHGLIPKLHADELEPSGGAELAVELDAASADHLGRVSDVGMRALARSRTVATLLPATLFFLGKGAYAPARKLIDHGATVALATDFNPGSSPTASMPLVMTIACSHMGMDPLEALWSATAGGARALRLEDGRGTLRAGAPADMVVWAASDYREIAYRFGVNLVRGVWKGGQRVV
ncbi:MAG TPA: imidazolonepropionase [Longimicrobiales bacterium]|nr:imidazolonepropionase [Longimicrobiales bacterium]